jgi:hypothetical protein
MKRHKRDGALRIFACRGRPTDGMRKSRRSPIFMGSKPSRRPENDKIGEQRELRFFPRGELSKIDIRLHMTGKRFPDRGFAPSTLLISAYQCKDSVPP